MEIIDNDKKSSDEQLADRPSSVEDTIDASILDNQSKDILVYKQSRVGQTALLVPSALLTGMCEEDDDMKGDEGPDLMKPSDVIDMNINQMTEPILPPSSFGKNTDPEPVSKRINPTKVDMPLPVRPPPGFQSHNAAPAHFIQSTTQAVPLPSDDHPGHDNNPFRLSEHQIFGRTTSLFDHSSQPPSQHFQLNEPLVIHPSLPSYLLPETRNPFVSRLTQSYGVDGSSNNNSGVMMNMPMLAGQQSYFGLDNMDEDGLNRHDPFGLRALGIFSTDEKVTVSNTYSPPRNIQTRNPFYTG
jgi:hypothetical protein